jgi:hypothetical protein
MRNETIQKRVVLEKELRIGYLSQTVKCFGSRKNMCRFPYSERRSKPLNGDIFTDNCGFCLPASLHVEYNVIRNPEKINCYLDAIEQGILNEVQVCSEQAIGAGFKVRSELFAGIADVYPDIVDTVVENFNRAILLKSKLAYCRSTESPERYEASEACLLKVPRKRKHCETHRHCLDTIRLPDCKQQIERVNSEFCKCLVERRIVIRDGSRSIFEAVTRILNGGGDARDCAQGILGLLETEYEGWGDLAVRSLARCAGENPMFSGRRPLEEACELIMAEDEETLRNVQELWSFVRNFVFASIDRYLRYCSCQ